MCRAHGWQRGTSTLFCPTRKKWGRPLTTTALMELADIVSNLTLQDLKWKGAKYTWSNNSCGPRRIMCKLDRILVNQAWISEFVDSEAIFLPTDVSDHSPTLLQSLHSPTGGRSFRFFNKWISHPEFMDIVQSTWSIRVLDKNGREPTPMFRVIQKLKALKGKLKVWSRNTYSQQKSAITQTKQHLQLIQQAIQVQPQDENLRKQEYTLRSHLAQLL